MARTIDSARRVISGTWGELWIDGEKVAEVSACQAKVALNKETVNLCGRFMTTHKAMNASGTGSLTLHKVDSGFAQRMEGIKRGVDRRFTVISKLRDPDSYGAERVALYDVSFDDLAFTTLLGSEEEAAAFLADVQDMAAMTNYTYDEITGYAKSLVKPFGADKSLDILTTLSDASAALSLNESDNAVLIAGLSRMKLTDKTTQEYLNYFSERGIDVYEALSKWGDAAAVAEKVTRGEIRGSEAVEEILAYMQEQYGGLSEQMAGTYEGMVDNLADAEANAEAAYGEGYNEKRKEGIQAQMDWLNSGVMDEANRAIGAWQAELENTKEQYQREAVEAMMETDEYQQAQAEGDAAEMGRLIMQAKVQGMNEYNASEGAQLALESELALAAAIRDDASSNQAYWDAGYRKSQEYSKGLAAGMASALVGTGSETTTGLSVEERRYGNWRRGGYYDEDGVWRSHAAGLERVPYDGYAALLHEGERVLTAREARQADQGGGAQVTITGNTFEVRQESDIDAIAEALYWRLRLAQMGGVR